MEHLPQLVNKLTQSESFFTRKGAARELQELVWPAGVESDPAPGSTDPILAIVLPGLLAAVCDEKERVRTQCWPMVAACVRLEPVQQDAGLLLPALLPVLVQRVGSAPFAEPAEELRLAALRVFTELVRLPGADVALADGLDAAAAMLAALAGDPFHEIKRETAAACTALCNCAPAVVHRVAGSLLQAQLQNARHQRRKVRVDAVRAAMVLFAQVQDRAQELWTESLYPVLAQRALDRAPMVRKELATMLADWVGQCPAWLWRGTAAQVLSLVLTLIADDSPEVGGVALLAFEAAAQTRVELSELDVAAVGPGSTEDIALPEPFQAPPSAAVRAVVAPHYAALVAAGAEQAQDWQAETRRAGTGLLRTAAAVAQADIAAYLPKLLPALAEATGDAEQPVRELAEDAAALVGAYAPPDAQLSALMPMLTAEGATHSRAAALRVLAGVLSGMDAEAAESWLERMSLLLSDPTLTDAEPAGLRTGASASLLALVEAAAPLLPEYTGAVLNILRACLLLQASGTDAAHEQAQAALLACATACGHADVPSLLAERAALLQARLVEPVSDAGPASWSKDTPARLVWARVIAQCPTAYSSSADACSAACSVFSATCQEAREPDLRLAQLAVLDTWLGGHVQGSPAHALVRDYTPALLLNVLLPSLVWRPGRVHGTVRKVALAATHTMLLQQLLDASVLRHRWADVVPPITTCLTDNEATSRHIAAVLIKDSLQLAGSALDGEAVRALYPELLKRLDDASNEVRLAGMQALAALAKYAPSSALAGGPVEYTLEALAVHMDDTDSSICQGALAAALDWVPHDPANAERVATEARTTHRSPALPDQLLAAAQAAREAQ